MRFIKKIIFFVSFYNDKIQGTKITYKNNNLDAMVKLHKAPSKNLYIRIGKMVLVSNLRTTNFCHCELYIIFIIKSKITNKISMINIKCARRKIIIYLFL